MSSSEVTSNPRFSDSSNDFSEGLAERFRDRHIGPSTSEIAQMLQILDMNNLDDLINQTVPEIIRDQVLLRKRITSAKTEVQALEKLRKIAKQNLVYRSYLGQGYYGTITPKVILRNILENPAWYTAYTPYQPEISQGRLEALFLFQTLVCELTGLEIANASMLDEGTAGAEAITMAIRSLSNSHNSNLRVLLDSGLHPQTLEVMKVRLSSLKIDFEISKITEEKDYSPYSVVALSQWHTFGNGLSESLILKISEQVHQQNGLLVMATDLLALTINTSPGELGADIAFGSSQRFGVPIGFGGPAAGFLSAKAALSRALPGRLVGKSVDTHGNPAYRLALQTREQHIRREKATSNICTAQVLLAVISSFYGLYHGKEGLIKIAQRINNLVNLLSNSLKSAGYEVKATGFFDTISVTVNETKKLNGILENAKQLKINLRLTDNLISIALDETVDYNDILDLAKIFNLQIDSKNVTAAINNVNGISNRKDNFLSQGIYNQKFSETKMLRYIRSLSDKDLALDRTMIPLGSCTMKLNATSEMIPVTWKEFGQIHPFAPIGQFSGYLELIKEISSWLVEITGYDCVSLAPNAGSQGEYAGLLAIRQYLDNKGEQERNICLIPASAHGTNAASATMAGMKVVVVECDEMGNVSISDLKEKINHYQKQIAALMITYPSTHGVFEEQVKDICAMVHDAGGQVYLDGANLNALVGLASPGKFGADVSHLNLHKTFAIPHGGGGPGIGPVIARSHLGPFLPKIETRGVGYPFNNLEVVLRIGEKSIGPVTSAPFGSAGVLPISWMYIQMMGGEGLEMATKIAILNANYIAKKLETFFPILYKGKNGFIAHECILDFREITKETGVTVDDVAKRLMDFGFHAPTMSFPVTGTLMVEPTESEDKGELDRFIEAMIVISTEIQEIREGKISVTESPLRFAPHTQEDLLRTDWNRQYTREIGAFPLGLDHRNSFLSGNELQRPGKFWPSVGRIDGVFGDRNLVCACEPISAYQE